MVHDPLIRLRDGTVKQVNPFTGTQVWTVPGRANRPLSQPAPQRHRLDPEQAGRHCAFCERRYLDTPPEKARLVRVDGPDGGRVERLDQVAAEDLDATLAQFRLVPNLFEILSFDYWRLNHGYAPSTVAREHERAYLASAAGRRHVLDIARVKAEAAGAERPWEHLSTTEQLRHAQAFFGGCHDVIVARRHHIDGAQYDDELATSGTLTPDEHEHYLAFTADAIRMLYRSNPHARYVQAFQNWLRPAGASFDHLHKQVVAIDELSADLQRQIDRTRSDPLLYARMGVGFAAANSLTIAENDHAVAVAGVGHRFPSVVVYAKSAVGEPWRMAPQELRGFSDILHAVHAATGPAVPVNEQWYHQPPGIDVPMPFRVVHALRISTLAGFEGGTKIYLNTIDPWTLAARFATRIEQLREVGEVAAMAVGRECVTSADSLRYAGA